MKNTISFSGCFDIEAIDAETGQVLWTKHIDNLLTTASQKVRAQMLTGSYTGGNNALQIKYFAFGTGSTPATINDTTLQDEVFRKQVTQLREVDSNTVQSIVSLGSLEANFTIREIGVFCGSAATSAANTGTLLSRVVVNIEKNSNIVFNVIRSDTCLINT